MGDTAQDLDDRAMVEAAGVSSFSELLMLPDGVLSTSDHLPEDSGEDGLGFVFSGENGSRMLCFSGGYENGDESLFLQPSVPLRASVPDPTCINTSCKNSIDACTVDKSSNKKRTGSADVQNPDHNRKAGKKCKRNPDKSSSVGIGKVRKERLGERIAALQQLVSPYGKTDAASVLYEAMGYIKFLQDQIQVLSSPYLINHSLLESGVVTDTTGDGKAAKDLRSRGLCLVPVSSTLHVENSNGADFWSPATATMGHSHTTTTSPSMPQRF